MLANFIAITECAEVIIDSGGADPRLSTSLKSSSTGRWVSQKIASQSEVPKHIYTEAYLCWAYDVIPRTWRTWKKAKLANDVQMSPAIIRPPEAMRGVEGKSVITSRAMAKATYSSMRLYAEAECRAWMHTRSTGFTSDDVYRKKKEIELQWHNSVSKGQCTLDLHEKLARDHDAEWHHIQDDLVTILKARNCTTYKGDRKSVV